MWTALRRSCLVSWMRMSRRQFRTVEARVIRGNANAWPLCAVAVTCVFLAGCSEQSEKSPANASGDVKRGMDLIKQYGCGGCHLIPGIANATGNVGPPLLHVGTRTRLLQQFTRKHGIVDRGSAKGVAWQRHAANGRNAAGFARHCGVPLHIEMSVIAFANLQLDLVS
jgi:hypothetical protein